MCIILERAASTGSRFLVDRFGQQRFQNWFHVSAEVPVPRMVTVSRLTLAIDEKLFEIPDNVGGLHRTVMNLVGLTNQCLRRWTDGLQPGEHWMFVFAVHFQFFEKRDVFVGHVSVTGTHVHDTVEDFVIFPLFFQIELIARKSQESETFSSVSIENFIEISVLASITSVSGHVGHHHNFSFVGGEITQFAVDHRVIEIIQRHVRRWSTGRPAFVRALHGIVVLERGRGGRRRFAGGRQRLAGGGGERRGHQPQQIQ